MTRRTFLATLAAFAAFSTVAPHAHAAEPGPVPTFDLRTVTVLETHVDNAPTGIGPGDRFEFVEDLFTWGTQDKVGSDSGDCVLVQVVLDEKKNPQDGEAQCSVTLALPGGDVAVVGHFKFSTPSVELAVVGGTGKYVGAKGWVVGTDLSDEEDPTDKIERLQVYLT